jgi:uncharacterized protein (TIGR03067 family)
MFRQAGPETKEHPSLHRHQACNDNRITPLRRPAMRRIALLLFAAVFLAGAIGLGQEPVGKDKMLGTWKVVSFKTPDGEVLNPDALKAARIIIKADKMVWNLGKGSQEIKYKVDPKKSPKTIDLVFNAVKKDGKVVDEGKASPGIYELKGDVLKLCWDANGKSRPVEFATGESYKEDWRLLVLKRQQQP